VEKKNVKRKVKLTPKQKVFCLEYLLDFNATAAARRAGYSQKSSHNLGAQLMGKPHIQAQIQKEVEKRAKRTEITVDRVLQEIARVAFLDPAKLFDDAGKLFSIHDMDEDVRRAIASLELEELFSGRGEDRGVIGNLSKIRLVDKKGSLELLGKHLKMFTDKLEHTGADGGPIKKEWNVTFRSVENDAKD